ncbi:MAG TPA: ATP-grasp domain-containing protein [Acidobacteriota bacterium]|jgi:biotin carboxylase
MLRVLLLLPTTTYRTEAFLTAARQLGVDVTVASEEPSTLADLNPAGFLTVSFNKPEEATSIIAEFARSYPIHAVIPVDEQTAIVAAMVAASLKLRHNSVESALAAGNKYQMRELLSRAGVRVPGYRLLSLSDDAAAVARGLRYPCVVKPLILSASRGVIRADTREQFVQAFRRVAAILSAPEIESKGTSARQVLVEDFIPGKEVALEGLLSQGKLRVLALFDKPDPLDGPFFEETIYVTPSILRADIQTKVIDCTARTAEALGLTEGPVHAELRVNQMEPCVLEIAARSIGGRCARALRFGTGVSLEELILRHALGMSVADMKREKRASGVMMIPIPKRGVLAQVEGLSEARNIPGIDEISITAHVGQTLIPLPEGNQYLGFIFARGNDPHAVVASLRNAHLKLRFDIAGSTAKMSGD